VGESIIKDFHIFEPVDPFMDTSSIEYILGVVLYFRDVHSTSIKSFDVAVFVI